VNSSDFYSQWFKKIQKKNFKFIQARNNVSDHHTGHPYFINEKKISEHGKDRRNTWSRSAPRAVLLIARIEIIELGRR
jgi:hypothetical protein